MSATLTCSRNDCPLADSGRCIAGYADPEDCPDTEHEQPDEIDSEEDGAVSAEAEPEPTEAGPEPEPIVAALDFVYFGHDDALDLEDSSRLTAQRPCVMVLIAGEFGSGKTTLAVELYARFLEGPFGGWTFAGSETLVAFDERHKSARLSSGLGGPDTERTNDEEPRLLHLSLANKDKTVDLLLTDVKGETFEGVMNGQPVALALPMTARADLCLLMVDGERLADLEERSVELFHCQQLIGGLTQGGLRAGTPMVIVIAKRDRLPAAMPRDISAGLKELLELATARGMTVSTMELIARPAAGQDFVGLEEVLELMTREPALLNGPSAQSVSFEGRYAWMGTVNS